MEEKRSCAVCGVEVPEELNEYDKRKHGKKYPICSVECSDEFCNNPGKYAPDPNW